MELVEWQKRHNINDRDLSKLIGLHFSAFSHYRAGRRRFSPEVALKIEEVTNGEVTFKEAMLPALNNRAGSDE